MTGIYWYISRPKIDALLPEFGPRGTGFLKELSLAFKSPFIEAKAIINPERSVYKSTDQVRNGLVSAGAVSDV